MPLFWSIIFPFLGCLSWSYPQTLKTQKPSPCQHTLRPSTSSGMENLSVSTVCFASLIQAWSGKPKFHLELLICSKKLLLAWKRVRNVLEMSTIFSLCFWVSILGTHLVDTLPVPEISVETVWTELELLMDIAICYTVKCLSSKTI